MLVDLVILNFVL